MTLSTFFSPVLTGSVVSMQDGERHDGCQGVINSIIIANLIQLSHFRFLWACYLEAASCQGKMERCGNVDGEGLF